MQVSTEREFFLDNLLVRIHFIIVMIRWTGLAPWEFESPFPGSLTSTFLGKPYTQKPKRMVLLSSEYGTYKRQSRPDFGLHLKNPPFQVALHLPSVAGIERGAAVAQ